MNQRGDKLGLCENLVNALRLGVEALPHARDADPQEFYNLVAMMIQGLYVYYTKCGL